jgi:hypothetical protein
MEWDDRSTRSKRRHLVSRSGIQARYGSTAISSFLVARCGTVFSPPATTRRPAPSTVGLKREEQIPRFARDDTTLSSRGAKRRGICFAALQTAEPSFRSGGSGGALLHCPHRCPFAPLATARALCWPNIAHVAIAVRDQELRTVWTHEIDVATFRLGPRTHRKLPSFPRRIDNGRPIDRRELSSLTHSCSRDAVVFAS